MIARGVIITVLLIAAVCVSAPRPLASAQDPPDFAARLAALRPDDPLAYLDLAEEIADHAVGEAGTQEELDLAMHLFALAGALDPARLGRSACLGLAEYEPVDHRRRRWLAIASLLDDRGLGDGGEGVAGHSSDASDAMFRALSHYRRGMGNKALADLREPGAKELLDAYEALIPGGAEKLIENCKLYRTQLRPPLRERTITTMLRLERAVRSGGDRSWSGEILLTGGQPLIDLDPDRLDESLGVDASRPYYRGSTWVSEDDVE